MVLTELALLHKIRTIKLSVGSCAVRVIRRSKSEEHATVWPAKSHKRTQTRYFQFTKHSKKAFSTIDVHRGKISREIEIRSMLKEKKKIAFS